MKDISIIVPVYNVEKYLRKCLDSLVNQTLSPDKFEIIIVDDGSTDSSFLIAEEYASNYENIRVVHKKNAGLPQARKTGVDQAESQYIGFVDSDDWVEPEMYLKLLNTAISQKADIVCCNYILEYENGKTKVIKNNHLTKVFEPEQALKELHNRSDVYQFAWNKIYKKELFEHVCFPMQHIIGEDYTIVTQLLVASHKIVQIADCEYHYLQRSGSMCKVGYTENHYVAYKNYEKIIIQLIERYPELRQNIVNYNILESMALAIPMSRNKKYNDDMLDSIREKLRKNLFRYLKTAKDDIQAKGAAVLGCINPKLLLFVYEKLLNKY